MPGNPLSLDQVPHPFHHHLHHGGHHLPADRRGGLSGEWDGHLHLDQVSFIISICQRLQTTSLNPSLIWQISSFFKTSFDPEY